MDKCKYYLNLDGVNKVFNSDLELTEFIKEGMNTKKGEEMGIKFSKSTDGIQNEQDRVIDIIKSGVDKYSKDYLRGEDFFKEKHIIDGELSLLSPYFDNSNFRENYSQHLVDTDVELRELAKNNPEAAKAKALEIVDKKLDSDHRMYDVSLVVSDNMKNLISGKKQFSLPSILRSVAAYNLNTTDEKAIADYIENIPKSEKEQLKVKFDKWINKINSSPNKYISNINLSKATPIGEKSGVYSWLSYASVSPEGVPDIYEIKVTRDPINNWHSAKLQQTDYKLGLNRQLLQNVVSTADSSLFILPVVFPTDVNDQIVLKNIYIDDAVDRSRRDSKAQLDEGGQITYRLRQILPADTIVNQKDSEALDKLNQDVLDLFFPKYNFRTKIRDLNWENTYTKILRGSEKEPTLRIYDALQLKYLEKPNTPAGREEFKKVIQDYFTRSDEAKHSKTIDLEKAILAAKGRVSEDRIINFGRDSSELQNIFNKYLDPHWTLITGRPELRNSGVYIFKNTANNTFEVVSITINDLDQVNNLVGSNNTILGKFRTNESVRGDKRILSASNSNIEVMKALAVLNNNPDLVQGYSLNGIKAFNILQGKADFHDIDTDLYNFGLLISEAKKYQDIPNNFDGKDAKIKTTEASKQYYDEILQVVAATGNTRLKVDIDALGKIDDFTNDKAKLDYMLKLRDLFHNRYKSIDLKDQTKIQDFSKPEEYLNYLISAGITYYSGVKGIFDYDIPQYGMRTGDMTHWLKSVLFGYAPDYDKNGNKIVGLFQGSHFTTPDANKSAYMSKLYELITIASNKIRSDYNKRKSIIVKSTNDYYDSIGRSDLERMLLGNADQYHKVFFETHLGEITNDFKVKNPWDMSANLTDPQRRYLKQFIYNQYISKYGSDELDTFDKFEKSGELKQLLDIENKDTFDLLLKVPLIKKQSLSKYKSLTTKGIRGFIGERWEDMMSELDPRNLTSDERDNERQKAGFYQSVNGFRKMFNQFNSQESEEYRHKLISEHSTDFFEVNLDTIALKYCFETIREKQFNSVLPVIYAGLTTMKYYGWQTGKGPETEKALTDFFDMLKVSVHGVSIIKGKEVEEALNVVKKIQHITSLMTIALRPAMMIKELAAGTIRNISYAWSHIYGKDTFTMEDLTHAYGLFFKGQDEFNKIMELNNEYGFANRDLNETVNKTKVDRYGLNFMSSAMYWCNTFPDYINRLSLFMAKMHKDGTYDAHSINSEGQLVYDPAKDDRYSYYFKHRDRYKMGFDTSKNPDSKYNDQRNKYLYALEDFNAERYTLNETPLTEKDNIPRAYSSKERANIKTFSDMAHGYYDRDLSPLEKFLPTGIIFGQFMTFWPAKVKYYFGKEGSQAARESRMQKYKEIDGKKVPLFVKWEVDKDDNLFKSEVTESELAPEDARVEATEWRGELNEGLMYSLNQVARDLFTGHLDETDPQRIQQAKLMVHDLILMFSSLALGSILFQDLKKSKTDAEKFGQYERLATKVSYKTTNEFDPFSSTVGALQATPAFVSTLGNVKKTFTNMMDGKTSLEKFLHGNVAFAELLPNPETKH